MTGCLMLLLLTLIWTQVDTQSMPDGNACYSRFDYESKMLERIVMVEHRMNLLQEDTNKEMDQFQTVLRHMRKDQNSRHNEMMERLETFEKKLEHAQQLKFAEMTELGNDLKNMSDNLVITHQANQNELETKLQSASQALAHDIATRHSELVEEMKNFTTEMKTQHQNKLNEMTVVEKDLREQAGAMKEEQTFKLSVLEAIGDDIKLDMQERMVKLETAERDQKVEYDRVYKSFEEKVNSTWNDIKVSGLGIKPTVVFNIRDVANTAPRDGETIRFNYELINTDSVYDTSTGIFRAPIKGIYMFSVQLCGDDDYIAYFRIVINETVYSESSTITSYSTCMTSTAVSTMTKGDTAYVSVGNMGYNRYGYNRILSTTNRRSAFMGALIH